jgi:hypothetical protein
VLQGVIIMTGSFETVKVYPGTPFSINKGPNIIPKCIGPASAYLDGATKLFATRLKVGLATPWR